MIKELVATAANSTYGIIGLIAFLIAFFLIFFWTLGRDKSYLEKMD